MRQIHIDRAIRQAAAWNYEYVVLFGHNDLEFLEKFRDYYDMERGKYRWNRCYDPPYRTKRVFDVYYLLDGTLDT